MSDAAAKLRHHQVDLIKKPSEACVIRQVEATLVTMGACRLSRHIRRCTALATPRPQGRLICLQLISFLRKHSARVIARFKSV